MYTIVSFKFELASLATF